MPEWTDRQIEKYGSGEKLPENFAMKLNYDTYAVQQEYR